MEGKDSYVPLVHEDINVGSSTLCLASSPQAGTTSSVTVQATTPLMTYPSPNLPIIPIPVGSSPMRMRCYHCGADIKTSTTSRHKDTAHICCLLTAVSTCCLCFWIPYCCCNSFEKVDHKCPCCGSYLGTYSG